MKPPRHGFTLIELLIVIAIIATLSTIAYAGYGHMAIRAKNTSITTGINHLVKTLEVYRLKRGTYPLQQYANARYSGSITSTGIDIDGESGEKALVTLILNNPDAIKQLRNAELPARIQQDKTDPSFHGLWNATGFTYKAGYLDHGPPVTAASTTQIRHAQDWDHYADYLSKLFHGIEIPPIYSNDNRLTAKRKSSHNGKERVPIGATYSLIYRPDSGNLSVFISYALQGNTECGTFNVQRRTHQTQDNTTTCTIQIAKENIGKNLSGY